jgi:hypothetical protein
MNKTVLFTNWSNEDFSYAYAGEQFNFPMGKGVYLPDYLAHHFAKHLANRELQKIGGTHDTYTSNYNHPVFQEFFNKALSEPLPVESPIQAEVTASQLNEEQPEPPKGAASELEPPKPKKRTPRKKVTKPVEEEFAGLKE